MSLEHFNTGSGEGRGHESAPRYSDPEDVINAGPRILEGGGTNSVVSGRAPKASAPTEEKAPYQQKKSLAVHGMLVNTLQRMKDHSDAIEGAVKRSRNTGAAERDTVLPQEGRIVSGGSEINGSAAERAHSKGKSLMTSAQSNLDLAADHFAARQPARAGKYILQAAKDLHKAHKAHSSSAITNVTATEHPVSKAHMDEVMSQAEGVPKFKEERKASGVVQLGDSNTSEGMGGRYVADSGLLRKARQIAGKDAPVTKKIETAVKPTRRIAKPDRDKELKLDSKGREINKSRTLGGRDINPEKKADNTVDLVGRAGGADMSGYVPEKASTANPSRPKLGTVARLPKSTKRAATKAPTTPRAETTSVFPEKPAKKTYPTKSDEWVEKMGRKGIN